MAAVGAKLTIPFTVGTDKIVGQGNYPELWVLYSTSDTSSQSPSWTDATAKVRSFSTSRGRETELADVDAGTATVTLDNRDRSFDPAHNSGIRPMNRWWIREQFSGETQDIFVGYAESYDQTWPGQGRDAVCVVSCADEFKRLARNKLPATNPPRDSYADVVMFDKPSGYWRMDDPTADAAAAATVGNNLVLEGTGALSTPAAIVGDPGTYLRLTAASRLVTPVAAGESGDVTTLAEFTIEAWIKIAVYPVADRDLIVGPQANSLSTYTLKLLTAGTIRIEARNSAGTNHTATSPSPLPLADPATGTSNLFHHVVATTSGGSLRLYIDGGEVASTAWAGSFHGTLNDPASFQVNSTASAEVVDFDEIAVYRYGLPAARITAHYEAGTARGFPTQLPGARIDAALAAIGSTKPRRVGAGTRTMTPTYMTGQDPLSELRRAETADAVDALLFISRAGEIVFLADGHRSSSPYNTVQATFDDDGTDLPYLDVDVDYSDSFIANEWHVTRTGGTTQSATDTASQVLYDERPESLTDLPITLDADATSIAAAMLAKYKNPFQRIKSLTLRTNNAALAENVFRRDLGDRIRVFRTPSGGGARIDQTLFIQKIEVDGERGSPVWTVKLGVSPL